MLDQRRLVDRVGNAGDVDRLARARFRSFLPGRAEPDRPAPRLVDLPDLLGGVDDLAARAHPFEQDGIKGKPGTLNFTSPIVGLNLEIGTVQPMRAATLEEAYLKHAGVMS